MCKFKLDIETIKSKMRKFLTEHTFESEDMKPKENELIYLPPTKQFYNAVWFCVENDVCNAEMLQQHFGISTYHIMNLIYAMEVLELVAPVDKDDESRKVLSAAKEFLQYMENISVREYYELIDFRYFKTREEYEKRDGGWEDWRQCVIEEESLKEVVYQNGVYLVNDYTNSTWCELRVEASICKYKFFLSNIPCYIGGHKKIGNGDDYWDRNWRTVPPLVIEGEIFCDSDKDAKQCAESIEWLLMSGYGMPCQQYDGWFVGMDMGDVFMQFNGEPMRFLHHTFESSFDEESLMQLQKKINDARFIFHYFLLSEKDAYNSCLSEVDEAYEKILPEGDAELLWQFSVPSDCNRTVSIWYR